MRKFLKKIKRDCAGAVTVLVTLLLIPAVLISGTGVDLTRAYAAKSIAQDANQLAANSLLASYDAMLQDLYGLFGMMTTDSAFSGMVEQYVKAALEGKEAKDTGLGTFQLFYGSLVHAGDVQPAKDKNLANTAVLRRQIEEYAKYRAPVIIVEEIIAALDAFEKIQQDARIVKQKMDIDEKVEEIDKLYKQIYECINEVNKAGKREDSAYESINSFICGKAGTVMDIETSIQNMANQRELYHQEDDENKKADRQRAYNGYWSNVKALITGGTVHGGWIMGDYDEEGEYQKGYWVKDGNTSGLNASIGKSKSALKDYISGSKNSLEALRTLCEKADEKKEELRRMVDNLESDLNGSGCSEQLRTGMTEKDPDTQKSTLDSYRDLLQYDLTAMANAMMEHDKPQIQENLRQLEDDIKYGDPNLGYDFYCTFESLIDKLRNSQITYDLAQQLHMDESAGDDLERLRTVDPITYSTLGTFKLFQEFTGTHNKEFYDKLQELYGGENLNNRDSYKGALKELISTVQGKLKDIFLYEPEGAYVFENKGASAAPDWEEDTSDFIDKKDWGDDPGAINDAMSDSILTRIGEGMESAVNKILLLTYDSEMFSCYATGKGDSNKDEDGKSIPEINMNGIPLGIDVNYYYQSEMEYLFHGDRANAINNLKSVAGLIFLVRFVFNYVASFSIPSVKDSVMAIKGALSWAGPFATVAGELGRLALALAESALDVGRLKGGAKVSLYKQGDHKNDTDNGWRFSILGLIRSGASGIKKATLTIKEESDDDRNGMGYKDYMRLFLLLIDGDVLAQRTANLIEMNVTNKKENIGGQGEDHTKREAAMKAAEMFQMREAVTDFSLTTTLELKMLFLSMPFARQGVNGKIPPGMLEIAVTDYRGY